MATLRVANTIAQAFQSDIVGDSVLINALNRLSEYDKTQNYSAVADAMAGISKGVVEGAEGVTDAQVTMLEGLFT